MNVPIAHIRTATESALIDAFVSHKTALPGGPRTALEREAAFASFIAGGLPSRRVEAYHYTDLRALIREMPPLAIAGRPAGAVEAAPETADWCVVFVDGVFRRDASKLPDPASGIVVEALFNGADDTLTRPLAVTDDPVASLNTAFANDGVRVTCHGPGQGSLTPWLKIVHRRSGQAATAMTRIVIDVAPGARLRILERFEAAGAAHHTNVLVTLSVGEGAHCDHVAINREGSDTVHLSTIVADLADTATWRSHRVTMGARMSRVQAFVTVGNGGRCEMSGVSLLRDRQHADVTLVMRHAAPGGTSREYFKHIVDGSATGVFQGRIVVAKGAQKTDGGMKSQAILLDDEATMYNKPELEIFADDVVCGHGATCGDLDENQLFYARSRGIPQVEAEALLLEAFAGDAVAHVSDEALAERIMDDVRAWLAERKPR